MRVWWFLGSVGADRSLGRGRRWLARRGGGARAASRSCVPGGCGLPRPLPAVGPVGEGARCRRRVGLRGCGVCDDTGVLGVMSVAGRCAALCSGGGRYVAPGRMVRAGAGASALPGRVWVAGWGPQRRRERV